MHQSKQSIANMLANFSLYFMLFTFLCDKPIAQFTPSNFAPQNSIFNIKVDFGQVNDAVWELAFINNLLDDKFHPKIIHNMSNFGLYDSQQNKSCEFYADPKRTPQPRDLLHNSSRPRMACNFEFLPSTVANSIF